MTTHSYKLLDAGDGEKLEQLGPYVIIRPEPRALWQKTLPDSDWRQADAMYKRSASGGGKWVFQNNIPAELMVTLQDITFIASLTGFKHIGFFPEQAVQWSFIQEKVSSFKLQAISTPFRLLNLFAYTGGATLAAAQAGAEVVHVDAAKDIVTWARENAELNSLGDKPIRWIEDDALKFVKREVNRGREYEGIVLDPPSFGRGASGQVWKLEDDLYSLLQNCNKLLSPNARFLVVNCYATEIPPKTVENMLRQILKVANRFGKISSGFHSLVQESNGFELQTGYFVKWEA